MLDGDDARPPEVPPSAPPPPPPPTGDAWWVKRTDGVYGPYPAATLRVILADGRAAPTDLTGQSPEGPWAKLSDMVRPVTPPPATRSIRRGTAGAFWACGIGLLLLGLFVIPVALIWPAYRSAQGEVAAANTRSGLEQAGLALELYAEAHGGRLPAAGQWDQAISAALAAAVPEQVRTESSLPSYRYNEALAGKSLTEARQSPQTELARDPARRQGPDGYRGTYVLRVTGEVDFIAEE